MELDLRPIPKEKAAAILEVGVFGEGCGGAMK
jgi:hypothetical protein